MYMLGRGWCAAVGTSVPNARRGAVLEVLGPREATLGALVAEQFDPVVEVRRVDVHRLHRGRHAEGGEARHVDGIDVLEVLDPVPPFAGVAHRARASAMPSNTSSTVRTARSPMAWHAICRPSSSARCMTGAIRSRGHTISPGSPLVNG